MIAFRLSLSFKNCSKFAFIQKISITLSRSRKQTITTRVRKRPFLNVFFCFLMKMCSMMVFYYNSIWFIFHFTSCLLSLVRFVVRSRFTKIHTKNYCSTECVCVCFTSACVSVLFSFLGVYLWLAVCVVLLQYQIANMVQISQINLICFSSFFFLLKYIMIFPLLLFCVWLLCII